MQRAINILLSGLTVVETMLHETERDFLMIDNAVFTLTDEELMGYNAWAEKIATDMGNAEVESWTLNVTFSFSNLGTAVVAHCSSASDRNGDLVIREETDWE